MDILKIIKGSREFVLLKLRMNNKIALHHHPHQTPPYPTHHKLVDQFQVYYEIEI